MATTPASRDTPPLASAELSRAGADVWGDFAAELATLTELARTAPTAEGFYSEALRRAVAALAAVGGAVWTPQPDGRMRQLCLIAPGGRPDSPDDRDHHEQLLTSVARTGEPRVLAPRSRQGDAPESNHSPYVLVVAPVRTPRSGVAAIVELMLPPDAAPSVYRGAQRMLVAVGEVAAEFHAYDDLTRLRSLCHDQQQQLTLAERVHAGLSLHETAAAIANDGRSAIGCGRVSVLARHGNHCRLIAVSGVDHPDRRSRTVRGLQQLAAISCRLGDPLYLAENQEETLPQAADALHRYADEAGSRQIAVVPLVRAGAENEPEVVGAMVAESFAAADAPLLRDRVGEVARICGPALGNALEHDAVPLASLTRPLRRLTRPSTLVRLTLLGVLLAGAAATLLLTPAELRIEARGELQPVEQQRVFAPGDGVVQRVAVEHGQSVKQGELLLELHDPQLELELRRVEGERQTTLRQLEAVRATRSSLDARSTDRAEKYRLSAEQQQLTQRLESLDAQRELLARQQQALAIHSPMDGTVVTWELEDALRGRPVERGQELMSVVDALGEWRVELELPDDRIGHLIDAQQESNGAPLAVEYRLGSQEQGFLRGDVTRIAGRADAPDRSAAPGAARTIEVLVAPRAGDLSPDDPEVRPGASVWARVLCGRRSLGYVLTHDLIDAARVWWEF